jgi:hypothetical protein
MCRATERFELLMTSGKQKGKAEGHSVFRRPERLFTRCSQAKPEAEMVLSAFAWDGDPSIWTVRLGYCFQLGGTCATLSTKVHAAASGFGECLAAAPGKNVATKLSTIGHFWLSHVTLHPTLSWQRKSSEDTTAVIL